LVLNQGFNKPELLTPGFSKPGFSKPGLHGLWARLHESGLMNQRW